MSKSMWTVLALVLAVRAAAEEEGIAKTRHAVHRTATGSHHAAARASVPYTVHAAVGGQSAAASAVRTGTASGAVAPGSAPGAMTFSNGRPLKAPAHAGGSTPRMLRGSSGAANQNSGAAAPPAAPRGYAATAAAPSAAPSTTPGKIGLDRNAHPTAGPGIHQGDADSAPGTAGGGASKDPLGSILAGLAGMFKDMANMLGGGSGGSGNGG